MVEGLKGGVAMAEIARQEGISERGLRKYVRTLFARRAPEATGEFIATQMNRLNEALLVSFGAMSPENLPAVDRVVRIVRELDRYQGFVGGARGTQTRRKLLESLNSGAGTEPCPTRAALERAGAQALGQDDSGGDDLRDPLADVLPGTTAFPDLLSRGVRGTGMRRNPLESPNSGAGTAPLPFAPEDVNPAAAQGYSDLMSELTALLAGLAPQHGKPGESGT